MKNTLSTLLSLLLFSSLLSAQNLFAPDTLILEPVIGDPVAQMASVPSGSDLVWVNYDQDEAEGFCVESDLTPYGWFIESDFGVLNPESTTNDAFTSCSYLAGAVRNHNWLILPPLLIPDSSYRLCWRSLAYEGPAFMDGYKVVASTGSNLPSSGDFSHVLFTAAEMIKPVNPNIYTLNPADYVFSPGYIHANGYTDTSYFFFLPPTGPLRGKLEPHSVSMAEFAGSVVYVAFHHDSKDDSQLQIDDIIISKDHFLAAKDPEALLHFEIMPNPAESTTYVHWKMKKPEAGRLSLVDAMGREVLSRQFMAYEDGHSHLDLSGLQAGIYYCHLQTASGKATRVLVKI